MGICEAPSRGKTQNNLEGCTSTRIPQRKQTLLKLAHTQKVKKHRKFRMSKNKELKVRIPRALYKRKPEGDYEINEFEVIKELKERGQGTTK